MKNRLNDIFENIYRNDKPEIDFDGNIKELSFSVVYDRLQKAKSDLIHQAHFIDIEIKRLEKTLFGAANNEK